MIVIVVLVDLEVQVLNKINIFLYRFKFWRLFKAKLVRQESQVDTSDIDSYSIDQNLLIEQKLYKLKQIRHKIGNQTYNNRKKQLQNAKII